ncbi:MAG: archease [Candidatus Woesearchaeota archaeon]
MTSPSSEGYALTEHPADIGIEAASATREGILEHSCLGLMAVMTDPSRVRDTYERSFTVGDADPAIVLRRVLSEVLFLASSEGLFFSSFAITWGEDVRVVCRGEPIDPSRHELRVEVKAITDSGLRFERCGDSWVSFVLVDV